MLSVAITLVLCWPRRAREDLITVLEFSSCGAERLPYFVFLMSLSCSGLTLCLTSLSQTFGQKYGLTLCSRLNYVGLTLCRVDIMSG